MQYTHIVLRYGEIFLKGRNRHYFEKKLQDNITKLTSIKHIKRLQGRFIADFVEDHQKLRQVFGLVSYSPALMTSKDVTLVQKRLLDLLEGKEGNFRIIVKRSDKNFPIKSPELTTLLGQYVEKETKLRFDREKHDYLIEVEINDNGVYLSLEVIYCFGGIPTGVDGRVLTLVDSSSDILAALLMMKRGISIYPFSVIDGGDISLLQKYSPQKLSCSKLETSEQIETCALLYNCSMIVTGERLETITSSKSFPNSSFSVLRPLIAYNEERINQELTSFQEV
ncbi:hypothetical protein J4444_04040 [Candidatus Woesearchaeota archaeon]|nr:hypothetical protein [Candidatus Woesearchaeota archaeon]